MLPFLPLICLASLAAACVPTWLFVKQRAALERLASSLSAHERLFNEVKVLDAKLSALETRLDAIDQSRHAHSEWISQAEGLNLNRRGQVLRLHRRGDSASDIAAALRLGKGEVQLMIKVYELGRESLSAEQL